MDVVRRALLLVFVAGCVASDLVPCGDLACPSGTRCIDGSVCATDEPLPAPPSFGLEGFATDDGTVFLSNADVAYRLDGTTYTQLPSAPSPIAGPTAGDAYGQIEDVTDADVPGLEHVQGQTTSHVAVPSGPFAITPRLIYVWDTAQNELTVTPRMPQRWLGAAP